MGNVCLRDSDALTATDRCWSLDVVAGSGKSILWYVWFPMSPDLIRLFYPLAHRSFKKLRRNVMRD
jgi:hypothetical protein